MEFLFPQQHVRKEAVRLRALEQTPNFLLGQLMIDRQQGDRVEAGVPQPLEGVGSRGWADEVVGSPTPLRDALLTVGLQDASSVGRDRRNVYFSLCYGSVKHSPSSVARNMRKYNNQWYRSSQSPLPFGNTWPE